MKPFPYVDWSKADASRHSTERWNGASGGVVIMLGIAGAALEGGSPPFTAPIEEVVAFGSKYQRELLAQSVVFGLSAGAYLWFSGSLRSVLMRAEAGRSASANALSRGIAG